MNTDDWCHKHLKDRWLVYFNTDNLNLLGLWTQCSGAALHTGQLSVQLLFSTQVNSVFRCCSPHRSTQCSGAVLHKGQFSVQVLLYTQVNSVFRCCSPHRSTQEYQCRAGDSSWKLRPPPCKLNKRNKLFSEDSSWKPGLGIPSSVFQVNHSFFAKKWAK